ncbi:MULTISPECIES: GNAT family N-acetyltransferase [unclassified Nocardioides]|uniref:GNAT family N-acetyltransferase n=1 Tax=unclassified Nocardioides TaxID=2615069 RepID=UPI003623680C
MADLHTGPSPSDALLDDDAATLQARNSAAFWAAKGVARGHGILRERGYLAVVGDERAGTRVLVQEPDLSPGEVDSIGRLAADATGPFDVEDPFSATDLDHLGLRSWQMPVMVRPPGPAADPALPTVVVEQAQDLYDAELVIIESFGLGRFEPHRPGESLPASLLRRDDLEVVLAVVDGRPAGACVSMVDNGYGSHYWVGTLDAFRSRGVGRAVMAASLARVGHLPLTLTASRLGRPLYESLGYATACMSTWRSST